MSSQGKRKSSGNTKKPGGNKNKEKRPRQNDPPPNGRNAKPDNSALWVKEVERIGYEFSQPAKQWDRIMSVVRMVAKFHNYEEKHYIELLNPTNENEMLRKRPEKQDWDLKKVMKFTLKTGTLGPIYGRMKTEYERIRNAAGKKLSKGEVTQDLGEMAPWRDPQEAWQQGAAYVSAFWKCHPELTKAQAYHDAVQLAEKSYTQVKSGKYMIQDLMQQRRLRLSFEALEQALGLTRRVPHPKWPDNRLKDTHFICCTNLTREGHTNEAILELLEARNMKPMTVSGTAMEPIPALRIFARDIGDSEDLHPDDKLRFTIGRTTVQQRILTIKESDHPPFKKPSKTQQMEMSRAAWPNDGYLEYIGNGENDRFESEEDMVAFLRDKKFFGFFEMSKASKPIKALRMKEVVPLGDKVGSRPTKATELLGVCALTGEDGKLFYRWKLPAVQGHSLVESIMGCSLPDIKRFKVPGIEDECTGTECVNQIKQQYQSLNHTKAYKDILACEESCQTLLSRFDFDPNTYLENINKRGIDNGWSTTYGAILEYADNYKQIESHTHTLQDRLEKNKHRHPWLITPDKTKPDEFHFLPPGEEFTFTRNWIAANLVGMYFCIHGRMQEPFPEHSSVVLMTLTKLAENTLSFHYKAMGDTDEHYRKGMATWLKPLFEPHISDAILMVCKIAVSHQVEKDTTTSAEDKATAKYFLSMAYFVINSLPKSCSSIIKKTINKLCAKISSIAETSDDTSHSASQSLLNLHSSPTGADRAADQGQEAGEASANVTP